MNLAVVFARGSLVIFGVLSFGPLRAAAQAANIDALSGSWRLRASLAAAQSLTFDGAGHVLMVRSGVAHAYTVKSDASGPDPMHLRLALLDMKGKADSLAVWIRGRSEIDVTTITHPKSTGDTLVRYVRANPKVDRELRVRLEQALHP